MPTKEIGPTKIAWPHMFLRSALFDKTEVIERYSASDHKAVSIAANAKTPSHESSSRAATRLEAAPIAGGSSFTKYPRRLCGCPSAPRRPKKLCMQTLTMDFRQRASPLWQL